MDYGPDHKAFRRWIAIHLLLIGTPYPLVLRNSRVNERTFRLWIARLHKQGIDALIYRPIPGRPRKITPGQVAP
jgi:transposase